MEISNIEIEVNSGRTIKSYLVDLLEALWNEGESFSGKRPFGDSGWEYDLYIPLIREGVLEGKIDENGYLEELSVKEEERGHQIIKDVISTLRN